MKEETEVEEEIYGLLSTEQSSLFYEYGISKVFSNNDNIKIFTLGGAVFAKSKERWASDTWSKKKMCTLGMKHSDTEK